MLDMNRILNGVAEDEDEIEINITLGLIRKPPHIPKEDKKKVNFPNINWTQSTHNPTIFYIPLIDVTRDMMKSYMNWWANKYNGELTEYDNGERYELLTPLDLVIVKHDDKFWYAEINERIEEVVE